jgi:LmbE family N-acetylglucosaminyl deacetylase
MKTLRILAIGAHPDDLEILCAWTLAKYAAQGDHVTMAVATNGEVGSPVLAKKEIAEIRRQEALAAAAVIGADLIWINHPDEFLFSNENTRLDFLNVVRQSRPTSFSLMVRPITIRTIEQPDKLHGISV